LLTVSVSLSTLGRARVTVIADSGVPIEAFTRGATVVAFRVYLTVKSDLSLVIGDNPLGEAELGATLDQATARDRDQRIFLRADKTVDYGDLMKVMNDLRASGYLKIALVGLEGAPASAP
jgi:biopolymer transport protein ExbD